MTVDISLYAILDPARTRGRTITSLADSAAHGGASILQLRDKTGATGAFIEEARAVKKILAGRIPLIINDRVDVALASGADGVHIGREDMTPGDARAMLGPGKIIGVTIKRSEDMQALDPELVDYGCIGGVYATTSKDNPDPPVGLDGFQRLREQAAASGLPVGAIAGIDQANAADVILMGADGVAVISAIFMEEDVVAATRQLRGIVDAALKKRNGT